MDGWVDGWMDRFAITYILGTKIKNTLGLRLIDTSCADPEKFVRGERGSEYH